MASVEDVDRYVRKLKADKAAGSDAFNYREYDLQSCHANF